MLISKEVILNEEKIIFETGELAKQAHGSILLKMGDTCLLATVVGSDQASDMGFFPLSVEYREKAYAAGKIPGGYIKREARPSEKEILSARLTDRCLRPLFQEGYMNEVQILIQVLSVDKENDADVLGMCAASAALAISDIPWEGPIAGVRVGRINGEFIINPTYEQLEESDIDLTIGASADSIMMVEGEANEVSEADMLAALEFGHEAAKNIVKAIDELVELAGKQKREFIADTVSSELIDRVRSEATEKVQECLRLTVKEERRKALNEFTTEYLASLANDFPDDESSIKSVLHDVEKELTRSMIMKESHRLDGRDVDDIREIDCKTSLLPRTHGSSLFTRGQTQSLAVVTLGTKIDEQRMDALEGEFFKSYMLHYNFPPFCVGEARPLRGVSRREIGHGNLAERALKPIIPSEAVFPYTIRIVSEILESNGSSSMASVCAGSLALMDAGVPVKAPVAGIAMGLVKEENDFKVLTDILGDEDHLGDMDFKVAGTKDGITAFQMDIKVRGISHDIMEVALDKAKNARFAILEKMNAALPESREAMSKYAPRILTMQIKPDQIGAVIGPGGKVIRDIVERTGATIDIEDDGTVKIASTEPQAAKMAVSIIEGLTASPEAGKVYNGKVKKITNFGAFVEILPGKEGLLHISEIDSQRINRVEDVLSVGQEIEVKLVRIDESGKMNLSRKALL
ncbi:MAG: polyribonucleotide nucleotidyltransferase [Deferribacteres bacterium]|nr:polyribonucleotide nucleotidyltransferase [candidate division KSB1 bacterium]MCB9501343.1 polyribonucleotide nucleotidyltransferase [Deferribacteres bacterium]